MIYFVLLLLLLLLLNWNRFPLSQNWMCVFIRKSTKKRLLWTRRTKQAIDSIHCIEYFYHHNGNRGGLLSFSNHGIAGTEILRIICVHQNKNLAWIMKYCFQNRIQIVSVRLVCLLVRSVMSKLEISEITSDAESKWIPDKTTKT